MNMRSPVYLAIAGLAAEKDLSEQDIIEALENSLAAAFDKEFGEGSEIRVEFEKDTGNFTVYAQKAVVKVVENTHLEISLEDARKLDKKVQINDIIEINVTPAEFGRIAVQVAKQVIFQKIRQAEKDYIYREFLDQKFKMISGNIIRREGGTLYLDMGKIEGILPYKEQIPGEHTYLGQNLRTVVIDVAQTAKDTKIILSRAHPEFIKRLFENEVPEILQGTVEIKAIAREVGIRAKVAVASTQDDIDPIGACVGQKGTRIKTITEELGDEKVDIIPWDDDLEQFIRNALSPAKVASITINEEKTVTVVTVPEDQLSLAIGRKGQNVRLASKLASIEIEVKGIPVVEVETIENETEEQTVVTDISE